MSKKKSGKCAYPARIVGVLLSRVCLSVLSHDTRCSINQYTVVLILCPHGDPFIRLKKRTNSSFSMHLIHTQCFQSLKQASKKSFPSLPPRMYSNYTLLAPLLRLELHDRIPQEPHVPDQPDLRGLGPSQMLPLGPLLVTCGRVFLAHLSSSSSRRSRA